MEMGRQPAFSGVTAKTSAYQHWADGGDGLRQRKVTSTSPLTTTSSFGETRVSLDAMEQAAQGATALKASDYAGALSAYTRALIEHPLSPDYLTQRSVAFTRLKPPRHELALKDAEYAVLSAHKRAKREKIQAAQQRRAIALCGLGRYADAKFVLTSIEKWISKDAKSKAPKMEWDMWMARIEAKLKKLPESEQEATIKEYPDFDLPSEKDMLDQLKPQLSADGRYIFPEDIVSKSPEPSSTTNARAIDGQTSMNGDAKSTSSSTPSTSAALPKIRHEWYQNAQSINLTIYAKGVAKDNADIEIHDDSIYISFPHPSNPASNFTFSADPLFALIDPTQSTSSIMSTKVELTLKKAQAGQKWHNLEGTTSLKPTTADTTSAAPDAAKAPVPSTVTETAPSYPTSSRTGPKNWDKLADDLHAQTKPKKKKSDKPKPESETKSSPDVSEDEVPEDVDSDFESGDAVDGFFKKLYAGADDDTRRAMMKSYYESNGTALSTNWSEVGKGPVEVVKGKDD
ncbi:Cochaperone protein [Elasticomyces elasticus]|nr:Cochaperone protein [Elasticomyces elasticus]